MQLRFLKSFTLPATAILFFSLLGGVAGFAQLAMADEGTDAQQAFVESICRDTLEEREQRSGNTFLINKARFFYDAVSDSLVAAQKIKTGEDQYRTRISWLDRDQRSREALLPAFAYRSFAEVNGSIWFLQRGLIAEFDSATNVIVGTYRSIDEGKETNTITTRARHMIADGARLYIAHGEHGVVVFDTEARKILKSYDGMIKPGSMAAAVAVKDGFIYVLQGAYHERGFNGISILNMTDGSVHHVEYSAQSGVVNPYSSDMQIVGDRLFMNNGGWIHYTSLSELHGKESVAPEWLAIRDSKQRYLMIEGNLQVANRKVVACSSINYIPDGSRRVLKDWRMIYQDLP